MKTINIAISSLLALSVGITGCSSADQAQEPTEGNSYLTIVGSSNVFMEYGQVQSLTVRYHTRDGEPLAGQIDFAVEGSSAGSSLSAQMGVTNSNGETTIQVNGGPVDAAFQVRASANFTDAVKWSIAVSDSAVPTLTPLGSYRLDSHFDTVSGLDNQVGNIINTFLDMTDDENDPATWVLDRALEELDDGAIKTAINVARQLLGLDATINDYLLDNAPGFVEDIRDIGDNLAEATRKFGLETELKIISKASNVEGQSFSATHTMTGFGFIVDNTAYDFSMSELNVSPVAAADVVVTKTSQVKMAIGDHDLPISYGIMINVALDEVIIPLVVPGAEDLDDVLAAKINCDNVGTTIADVAGVGDPNFFSGLCDTALVAGAALVYDQILRIDADGVEFAISGEARMSDHNADYQVDSLEGGVWSGDVVYAGTAAAALAPEVNTFTGDRM